MKFRTWMWIISTSLFATLAITLQLSAQNNPNHKLQQYKLTQVGTFGGPNSNSASGPAFGNENNFNYGGATVGLAATNTPDPFSPNCWYDCFVDHALRFENGNLTDLGALPGSGNSSASYGINDFGLIVGVSENGSIDPATGYPEYHAVVWRNGRIRDLGTFGGSVSQAFAVNEWGQVVGVAANTVPDQYASGLGPCTSWNCWPVTTQQRAFLWEGGRLQDLGTLGTGNDAVAYYVNQFGQVAGVSYTNTIPNPTTGVPTQDPFLWDRGNMIDLGSLGGVSGTTYGLNNLGQVVGRSNLAGDQTEHAFLWARGALTDLGTLGGSASNAFAISDSGAVAGTSYTTGDQTFHAFLWEHGNLTDLGTIAGDTASNSQAVNVTGTVVGLSCATTSCQTERAFVKEYGGPMLDLNALVNPPSDLYLLFAYAIADSGEILAYGQLPSGDIRIAVLTPSGHCDSTCEERIAESANRPLNPVQAAGSVPGRFTGIPGMGRNNLLGPQGLNPFAVQPK
jgi:probable HAF family extracellular repeat protein